MKKHTEARLEEAIVDHLCKQGGYEEVFGKLMGDGELRKLAVEHLLHKVYGAMKN